MDWTQLQFEFVAVPVSEAFPCGSKMTYRKYSQDDVILIEACGVDEGRHGFNVLKGQVTPQPQAVPPDVPQGIFCV